MGLLKSIWLKVCALDAEHPMFVRVSTAIAIFSIAYNLRCVYLFDAAHVARSGALIVILGLYLGAKDLQGLADQDLIDKINRRIEETGQAVVSAIKEKGLSPDVKDVKVDLASLEQRFEMLFGHSQLFRQYITKRESSSLPADAAMAAAGTFFWGFGDLVPIASACYL